MPVDQLNLASIFSAAQNFKMGRAALEDRERKNRLLDQQAQVDARFNAAIQKGDAAAASREDPERYGKIVEQQQKIKTQQIENIGTQLGQRQDQEKILHGAATRLGAMQDDNQMQAAYRQQIRPALQERYGIELPETITREQLAEQVQTSEHMIGMLDDSAVNSEIAQRVFAESGGRSANPALVSEAVNQAAAEGLKKSQAAKLRPKGPLVSVNVDSSGKQALSKTVESGIQKEVISGELMLDSLDEIEAMGPARFLTAGSKALAATAGGISKYLGEGALERASELFAGDPEAAAEFVAESQEFNEGVETIFNAYRKLITGAASGEKELAKLQKAIINTSLSPAAFKGSLRRLRRVVTRNLRVRKGLLADGIDLSTDNGKTRLDLALMKERRAERKRGTRLDKILKKTGNALGKAGDVVEGRPKARSLKSAMVRFRELASMKEHKGKSAQDLRAIMQREAADGRR